MTKRQRTLNEMVDAAVLLTRNVEVREYYQVIGLVEETEPVSSPELGTKVVEAIRKVRKAMYFICSFENVGFVGSLDEHEATHGQYLLDSVDLVLSDAPYDVRGGL